MERIVCKGVHMVLEIAEFTIRSGQEDEFAVAYGRAAHLIRDHTEGFRGTASFRTWREKLGPFLAETTRVEHAVDIGYGDSVPVAALRIR